MGRFCKKTVVFLDIVIFIVLKVTKMTKVTAVLRNLRNGYTGKNPESKLIFCDLKMDDRLDTA